MVKLLKSSALEINVNLKKYIDQDVIVYDEHHGQARIIINATLKELDSLYDEYSIIIELEGYNG